MLTLDVNVKSFCFHLCWLMLVLPLAVVGRMRENDDLPAVVTFADGSTLSGDLRIMGSRPLVVTPTGGSQKRVRAQDILLIEQAVEKASLERPWTFKEAGKPEKIYFEGQYPLINFLTRVTLTTGEIIEGHVISGVYILSGETGKKKIFLKRQIKGKVGQELGDIEYVSSIRYVGNSPVDGARMHGAVSGCGKVLTVNAIDIEREQVLQAKVNGDRFDFGSVLPGRYDLCVLTDRMVVAGLSDVTPSSFATGSPIAPGDRKALEKVFPLADDFFNDRWIVYLGGQRNYARMLVYKRRAKYHDSHVFTPGGWVWHVDVWNWHNPGSEWKVDNRHILADELGAVEAADGAVELNYDTDGSKWRTLRSLD